MAAAQRERCAIVLDAMARHAPQCEVVPVAGGGSCWVRLPDGVDAAALAARAAAQGVLIEPGDVFFQAEPPPAGYFRLGYQSIAGEARSSPASASSPRPSPSCRPGAETARGPRGRAALCRATPHRTALASSNPANWR